MAPKHPMNCYCLQESTHLWHFCWYVFGKVVRKIRYTFSSNHNVHKSLCGLCFWAPDALNRIDYSKIYQLKVLEPKNKGHINFYECCDLTKNATYNRLEHFRALYVPKFEQNRLCSKLWRNEWSDSPISVVVIIMARSFPRHTHITTKLTIMS